MKLLGRIISHRDFWPVFVVVLVGILAGKGLIGAGYFNMHDDLQMMRQLEMEKCFLSFQIPCRWVPDMGYGFGFPLFNFYPPLPYLVGEAIRVFGVSFVDTVKLVFILSFVASGVTMYFLAKEFFGKFGGVISAIFYIWAPYHAVDVYVRGAMNEAWALIWFPLLLWISYRLIIEKKKNWVWIIGLALSWFGLLTSHNLMAMIFAPVFGLWCLLWIVRHKAWKKIPFFVISGILAFGLAAFFTIPVVLEQKFTHADSLVQGYYEYVAHFASTNQILFSRFWGYGPSVWGTVDDKMSFQAGHIHWILSLVVALFVGIRIIRKKKIDDLSLILIFLFIVGWFSAFMIHSRSTPIWQMFKTLNYVQFPWRFLTIVIFSFSFMAGSLVLLLPKKISQLLLIILATGLVIWNWSYFLPEHGKLGPLTDKEKFSGAAWDLQQTAGIYDYLPKTAEMAPNGPRKSLAEVMQGRGEIKDVNESTNWATFNTNIATNTSILRINIFQFPNWKVFVDGKEVEIKTAKDEKWGRMYIDLSKGEHLVYVRLYDTLPRTLGNAISLVSWVGLSAFLLAKKKKLTFLA